MRRYTKSHEWIMLEGGTATVGITPHAVEQLGDLVFVEATPGRELVAGAVAATVESVKAASEVYTPVAGEIVEGNQAVVDDPSLVNSDPLGAGWLFKLKPADPAAIDALMDEDAYNAHVLAG